MLISALDIVLDRTVAPGYSRLGYLARSAGWSGAQADPAPGALAGRIALATGGGGGLGLATVAGPARIGAAVRLVVHDAGLLPPGRRTTAQGHELTPATHVLGPHLLTRLLAGPLGEPGGRVLWVASGGMYAQRLRFDEPDPYDGTTAYARTKRMQVVLSGLWAHELRGRVDAHAVHPGWADTPGPASSLPGFGRLLGPLLRTAEQGADTAVWLAAAPADVAGTGRFWHDRRPRPEHYVPWTREIAADRAELWARAESLTS
ncbi:dehydrogenase [Pseudonocardia oceani]|uniref:dehydrogenase n=1 Tax=Pseudonocardia oceani TaxID=2792013 RepID=UPI0027E39F08|nr:dehydrogenase [Pseudonocardia oceani]